MKPTCLWHLGNHIDPWIKAGKAIIAVCIGRRSNFSAIELPINIGVDIDGPTGVPKLTLIPDRIRVQVIPACSRNRCGGIGHIGEIDGNSCIIIERSIACRHDHCQLIDNFIVEIISIVHE